MASYLTQYGNIIECKVVMDANTGRSKGYGFVVYSTPQEAQTATAEGYVTVDGKRCNCNLASVGAKKDGSAPVAPTKKRSYADQVVGTEAYAYADPYAEYSYNSYDKRQRTETMMHPGYSMPTGVAGIDLAQQNLQVHISSSLTAMYADIQTIKYEMTMMTQNLASLKSSITAMKVGVDALCARNGIAPPAAPPAFHQ
uniref:RRM domain-containing protein n=1 Tax=Arcella intermedia TaxID=1963864 RepID=A0A6B2LHY2_9EUKA